MTASADTVNGPIKQQVDEQRTRSQSRSGGATVLGGVGRALTITQRPNPKREPGAARAWLSRIWSTVQCSALAILVCGVIAGYANAAVTLVDLGATVQGLTIVISWETASELDMLGFYVQRSTEQYGSYERISEIIPAIGGMVGAYYEHTDANVTPGTTYWYKLESIDNAGAELFGPVSAAVPGPATNTPTVTPTPGATTEPPHTPRPGSTPLPTHTPTPRPTPRPVNVEFWADRDELAQGECTTIHWRVENALAVFYDGRAVTGREDRFTCPSRTTTFVLRITTDEGDVSRELSVAVREQTLTPSPTVTPVPPSTAATQAAETPTVTRTPGSPADGGTPTAATPAVAAATSRTPSPTASTAMVQPSATPSRVGLHATETPAPTQATTSLPDPTLDAPPANAETPTRSQRTRPLTALVAVVVLVVVGGSLVLAGAWGLWRTRGRE